MTQNIFHIHIKVVSHVMELFHRWLHLVGHPPGYCSNVPAHLLREPGFCLFLLCQNYFEPIIMSFFHFVFSYHLPKIRRYEYKVSTYFADLQILSSFICLTLHKNGKMCTFYTPSVSTLRWSFYGFQHSFKFFFCRQVKLVTRSKELFPSLKTEYFTMASLFCEHKMIPLH